MPRMMGKLKVFSNIVSLFSISYQWEDTLIVGISG